VSSSAFRTTLESGEQKLVREVWVSTRVKRESSRVGAWPALTARFQLKFRSACFMTNATEGHFAFGAGMLLEDPLADRIGLSAQRPVPPERFSHIGTRSVGGVLTNSGTCRGCCRQQFWVEHATGELRVYRLERPEATRRLQGGGGGETLQFSRQMRMRETRRLNIQPEIETPGTLWDETILGKGSPRGPLCSRSPARAAWTSSPRQDDTEGARRPLQLALQAWP
jgi:hypothetical protein